MTAPRGYVVVTPSAMGASKCPRSQRFVAIRTGERFGFPCIEHSRGQLFENLHTGESLTNILGVHGGQGHCHCHCHRTLCTTAPSPTPAPAPAPAPPAPPAPAPILPPYCTGHRGPVSVPHQHQHQHQHSAFSNPHVLHWCARASLVWRSWTTGMAVSRSLGDLLSASVSCLVCFSSLRCLFITKFMAAESHDVHARGNPPHAGVLLLQGPHALQCPCATMYLAEE